MEQRLGSVDDGGGGGPTSLADKACRIFLRTTGVWAAGVGTGVGTCVLRVEGQQPAL